MVAANRCSSLPTPQHRWFTQMPFHSQHIVSLGLGRHVQVMPGYSVNNVGKMFHVPIIGDISAILFDLQPKDALSLFAEHYTNL